MLPSVDNINVLETLPLKFVRKYENNSEQRLLV